MTDFFLKINKVLQDQRNNSESERAISESSDETKSILDTNLPAQVRNLDF